MIFYNDNDPACIKTLKAHCASGNIPFGVVNSKPIQDLLNEDLSAFIQCHFFAGIGGWPYALQLAGWPNDSTVWTGSCPCQPFSCSGNLKHFTDPRDLWPEWFRLIQAYKPPIIFGEQVSGEAGYIWLDRVGACMESEGYTIWACDIPACSVNAPHVRSRLYWVAYTLRKGLARSSFLGISQSASSTPKLDCYNSFATEFYGRPNSLSLKCANGLSRPVDTVRLYGNSIVPRLAAVFIRTFLEVHL